MTPRASLDNAGTLRFALIGADGAPLPFSPADLAAATFSLTAASGSAPAVVSFEADDAVIPRYVLVHLDAPLRSHVAYTLTAAATFHTSEGNAVSPSATLPAGFTPRASLIASFFSNVFNTSQPVLRALVSALAYVDEQIAGGHRAAAVELVRLATTLAEADAADLDRCASGYGVRRLGSFSRDALFRVIAQKIAVTPKANRKVFHDVINTLLGASFAIYEVEPGKVAVEVVVQTDALGDSDQGDASYLKADATVASAANNTGDYLTENASTDGPVGKGLVWYAPDADVSDAASVLADVKAAGVQIEIIQKL